MPREKRTIVYIDGFNLYHGMKEKYGRRYSWLNLCEFAKSITPKGTLLTQTKYFTSRIKGDIYDPTKHIRQAQYLNAVRSLFPLVTIIEGTYQAFQSHCKHCNHMVECKNCGVPHIKPNEKKTDVNIATAMLVDMFEKRCDVQILVSGDSDYENTLKELRRLFPTKDLIVAFPPRRRNNKLVGNDKCSMSLDILESSFTNSQFPNEVSYKTRRGKIKKAIKPATWI